MARYDSALDEKIEQVKKKNKPIQVKGPSGQLIQVQPKNLAQASELQTGGPSPITPVGASQMGVGPDSAKMAGTALQKGSALKQAMDPSRQLSTVQRTAQARDTASAEEQKKLEKSANLEAMGGLGDRINNLISGQFDQITESGAEIEFRGAEGAPLTSQQTSLKAAIDLPEGPEREAAITTAIEQLANASEDGLLKEDILALFPNPAEAISVAVNAGLGDRLEITDDIVEGLGFDSLADVEAQTGIQVPPGTTLQEFQSIVEGEITAEFNRTESLKSLINDPHASPQERSAARQELLDMGAIGLSAGEQAAHQVEQAIAEADEITFGGEKVSVEDLLDDEFVSGMIERIVDDPKGDFAKKIAEENPDFAAWITENQEALADLSSEVETEIDDVEKAYEEQQELVNVENVGSFDKKMIEKVFGIDMSEYGADTSALTESQLYKAITSGTLPEANKRIMLETLNKIGNKYPEFTKQLANLTPKELRGAFQGKGLMEQFASYSEDPTAASPAEAFAFSNINTMEDLLNAQDKLKSGKVAQAIGNLGAMGNIAPGFFDKYGSLLEDGTLDAVDASQIANGHLGQLYYDAKGKTKGIIKKEFQNRQEGDLVRLQADNKALPIDSIEELETWEMPDRPTLDLGPIGYAVAENEFRNTVIDRQKSIKKSLEKLLKLKMKYPVGPGNKLSALISALRDQQKELKSSLEYGP